MEQRIYTIWNWINHHWLVISLVYLPALNGYLNTAVVFLKVMGWTKLADFLGKFEDAIKASVDAYKSQKQGGINEKIDPVGNSSVSPISGPGPNKPS